MAHALSQSSRPRLDLYLDLVFELIWMGKQIH